MARLRSYLCRNASNQYVFFKSIEVNKNIILMVVLEDDSDYEETDDEYEQDDNPNCSILKEKIKCHWKKKGSRKCKTTTYFICSPTCGSYARSTEIETSNKHTITTIYLCLTSTTSSTPSISIHRSIPIFSTVANSKLLTKISITPSFPMSSTIDENSGSGSGDDVESNDDAESDDDPISSSVSVSPCLSTVTSSPLSSALPITPSSSSGDRTVGENVFSSVVPSFTVQFPSSFPSTATAMLPAESSVSSISPSPSLRTAGKSLHIKFFIAFLLPVFVVVIVIAVAVAVVVVVAVIVVVVEN